MITVAISAKAAAVAFAALAEGTAIYSVIEIGPNLLAAVTSIIGAAVFVAQLLIARRMTRVETRAGVAETAAKETAHLAQHAAERATEAERKAGNGS